jgi:hypothetical protein
VGTSDYRPGQLLEATNPLELAYFHDDIWRLAPPAAAQRNRWGAINWRIRLDDGSDLTDPIHRRLLWHLKMLLGTAIIDPRGGKAVSEGGLSGFAQTIATGASWMVSEGMDDFSRLDNAASWRYYTWFVENYEGSGGTDHRRRKLTWSSANLRLRFPALVYRQQPALALHGLAVDEEPPLDGRSIDAVVSQDLQMRRGDKETPIPDGVFLSIVAGAMRLLDQAAEDVIELQALCCPQLNGTIDDGVLQDGMTYAALSDVLASYIPSTLPGEAEPWIDLTQSYTRVLDDGRKVEVEGRQILRRAIVAIQMACVTTIQSLVAIRVDQLASIEDENFAGELPSCVTTRRSQDGLMEKFYVKNINLKARDPDLALIGSRSWGSDYLPPAVRALSILHRLTLPWRVMANTKRLLIVFSSARGLPRTGKNVSHATSSGITIAERDFFRKWCNHDGLSTQEKAEYVEGKGLRDQKWRTTFAIFKTRLDDRLLPEVAEHFRHMRNATTEHRYVGSDARTMGSEVDPAYYESARLFYDVLEDGEPIIGRFADFVRSFGERYSGSVQDYELAVTALDFRFFVFDYGVCGMAAMPERSACNKNGGTESWLRVAPNEAFRTPLTCVGCPCFAAITKHLRYWENRTTTLELFIARADDLETNAREVLKLRLRTATAIRDGLRSANRRSGETRH